MGSPSLDGGFFVPLPRGEGIEGRVKKDRAQRLVAICHPLPYLPPQGGGEMQHPSRGNAGIRQRTF